LTLASLVPGFVDIRQFKWRGYGITTDYTYMLDLNQSLDEIWNGVTSRCRQKIRKCQDLNCRLEKSQDVSPLIELLKERYLERGMNYLVNTRYLNELLETFPNDIGLYYLHNNDKIIGASLNHEYNGWYLGWIGLTKPKNSKYKYVNDSMLWSFIQQAKAQGFKKFEISGANDPNLCQFRTKFNPQLEICMQLSKKDFLGKIGEKFYLKFIKAV
jgi:lipid II:glycine glycyltransferase (peptidoglycan interpeptide bridge formation enzyme)